MLRRKYSCHIENFIWVSLFVAFIWTNKVILLQFRAWLAMLIQDFSIALKVKSDCWNTILHHPGLFIFNYHFAALCWIISCFILIYFVILIFLKQLYIFLLFKCLFHRSINLIFEMKFHDSRFNLEPRLYFIFCLFYERRWWD